MDEEGFIFEDTGVTIQEDQAAARKQSPKRHKERVEVDKPDESILEWFDRSVESQLEKHRLATAQTGQPISPSQGIGHLSVLKGAAAGVEITTTLAGDPNTELMEAVEKYAEAKAIVGFEGAVRAAEMAASNAPPELAEEAAAAGARGYQAELTGVVKDRIPGDRPIEVVGYVGITKPKHPLKPRSLS